MADRPIRAAVYARISKDREGRELGVERQVADAKAQAERLGWTLHPDRPVYIDNDVSASTRSRKRRPQYEALLAAVRAGQVDGVVYYSTSRFTRRPLEFEDVVKVVEETGVRLASCVSGIADLTTADGRFVARVLAAQDAAEAERIGERVAREQKDRREVRGLPHIAGTRCFGYEADGLTARPDEADAIRLGCKLILDGASLGDVVREWTRRGVVSVNGQRWSRVTVRRALTRQRYTGVVTHKGTVVGPGKQEVIIEAATMEKVKAAISARSSLVRARYSGREHLLSGLLWCSVCGHRVKVVARRDEHGEVRADSFVACIKDAGGCGHVKRNRRLLEAYVFAVVERRLADVRPIDGEEDTDEGREYARLVAERDAVQVKIEKLRDLYETDPDFEAADFVPMVRKLRAKLADVEAAMSEYEQTSPVDFDGDVLGAWRTGTWDERRAIIERVVSEVRLHPIGNVGPVRARAAVPETTEVELAC